MNNENKNIRYVMSGKGVPVSTIFAVSNKKQKDFNRAVVCIKERGVIYKIIAFNATKSDGSINAFFSYCNEKKGYIFQFKHKYKVGIQKIYKEKIVKEYIVNKTTKLSIHRSGFVQISGNGILSGIDEVTGCPKGIGVFSSPLDMPVSSGPTIAFMCWNIANNFEKLTKREKNVQYIVLSKDNGDFFERIFEKNKNSNTYLLEFFIFPEAANQYIYEYENNFYINHISNCINVPSQFLSYPVIDIKYFKEVLSVFPCVTWSRYAEEKGSGYVLSSPGGSGNISDESKSGNNFFLICPRRLDDKDSKDLQKLELNN